ncbi:hypothetical protein [Actinokineospora cianjurensis]|uniref:Uncharacterized protein n=1 Tax=Actinokineospora cianjurensis TaxID=585224 RepID=A0A421AYY3_9PSEU|nr:hypothetical protein [Actinokineospora cianjurensis]RLK55030.1 hypothetical protein CLV68_5422 [Actinokineospora cianjurensis]
MRDDDLITELATAEQHLRQPPNDPAVAAIMARVAARTSSNTDRAAHSWKPSGPTRTPTGSPRSGFTVAPQPGRAVVARVGSVAVGTKKGVWLIAAAVAVLAVGASALVLGEVDRPGQVVGAGSPTIAVAPESTSKDGCEAVAKDEFVPVPDAATVGWVLPSSPSLGELTGVYWRFGDTAMMTAMYQVGGARVVVERYSPAVGRPYAEPDHPTAEEDVIIGRHLATWTRAPRTNSYPVVYTSKGGRALEGVIICKGSRLTWTNGGYTYAISGPVSEEVLLSVANVFLGD